MIKLQYILWCPVTRLNWRNPRQGELWKKIANSRLMGSKFDTLCFPPSSSSLFHSSQNAFVALFAYVFKVKLLLFPLFLQVVSHIQWEIHKSRTSCQHLKKDFCRHLITLTNLWRVAITRWSACTLISFLFGLSAIFLYLIIAL